MVMTGFFVPGMSVMYVCAPKGVYMNEALLIIPVLYEQLNNF